MSDRKPGFYWIGWAEDARASVPGPVVGEWDGSSWWIARIDTYRFDSEVVVLSARLPQPSPYGRVFRFDEARAG